MIQDRRILSLLPLFAFVAAVAFSLSLAATAVNAHEDRETGDLNLVVGFLNEPAYEAQPNGAYIKITKMGADIVSHGALFSSGPVEAGNSFEFEFGHDLEDLEIPFHDHLTGQGGTITVGHDGEHTGTAMVQFDPETGFSPHELSIQADTTVMFMNTSDDGVMTVISGLHETGEDHDHEHAEGGATVEQPVLGLASSLQVEVTHVPTGEEKTMGVRPVFGDPGAYVADFVPTAPGAYSFRFFGDIEGEAFDETFTSGPNTFDEIVPSRSVQFPVELRETRELQGAIEGLQTELTAASDAADDADSSASTALLIAIVGIVVGIVGIGVGGYGMALARRKS